MSLTQKRAVIALIFALILSIILSCIFIFSITFAGNPQMPDATATYTQNALTWDTGSVSEGSVKLNIFGEPKEGEDLPEVNPFSHGKYYLRLKNDISGDINYTLYFYCENEANIPLKFNFTETDDMRAADKSLYPKSLKDYEVLSAYSGKVSGKNLKDFEISWKWDTESDESDTLLGNQAVNEDLIYTFHVMFVIEDNNTYENGGGGSSGGGGGGSSGGGGGGSSGGGGGGSSGGSGSTGSGSTGAGGSTINEIGTREDDGDTGTSGSVIESHSSDSVRLLHRAYVYGYDEGDFRPDGDITRAEVTAIFSRIISNFDDESINTTDTPFTDVNPEAWYPRYISYLSKTGIINGYTDGSFKPFIPITRREFAVICTNYYEKYFKKLDVVEVSFNDVDKSDWGYDFISKGYAMGWLSGYPDGTFRGDRCITRAEAVTIMNRILGRTADNEYIDNHKDTVSEFTDMTDNSYWAYYEIYEAAKGHIIIKNDSGERWVD